jgi:hypothetical protein
MQILFTDAIAGEAAQEASFPEGSVEILPKPFKPSRLCQVVQSLLARRG